MAVPHAYDREFVINGVTFRHYHATDAHGSVTNNHWLNNTLVSYYAWNEALVKALGDGKEYVLIALGTNSVYNPDWSRLVREEQAKRRAQSVAPSPRKVADPKNSGGGNHDTSNGREL